MNEWYLLLAILVELTILFFISRHSINQLFHFIYHFTRSNKVTFFFISMIFLPGTVLHELSHFFTAMSLMLRVRDMTILPEWDHNYIKLGSVVYEKKDAIRSIVVCIAPIFLGIIILLWLSMLPIFESETPWWVKALVIYFVFTLSTTMFSSKQDLVDTVFIIPFIIVIGILIYFLKIDLTAFIEVTGLIIAKANNYLYAIVNYLGISIGIHILFLAFIWGHKLFFIKKHG